MASNLTTLSKPRPHKGLRLDRSKMTLSTRPTLSKPKVRCGE